MIVEGEEGFEVKMEEEEEETLGCWGVERRKYRTKEIQVRWYDGGGNWGEKGRTSLAHVICWLLLALLRVLQLLRLLLPLPRLLHIRLLAITNYTFQWQGLNDKTSNWHRSKKLTFRLFYTTI